MKVSISVGPEYREPEVVIRGPRRTGELEQLGRSIERLLEAAVTGYRDDQARRLPCSGIARFYVERDRVYAQGEDGLWSLREKLYELEGRLDPARFVRISRFEIVNLWKVERLDTSVTGTIRMYLEGGIVTYVSRRNVAKLKKALGL